MRPLVVVFLALNGTISGAQLSRFFKSAAFPILLVILLAFFVQNIFYGGAGTKELTFNEFQKAVAASRSRPRRPPVLKTKDLVVSGTLKTTGKNFQVGFTQAYNMEEFLLANNVDFNTDIQKSSIWVTLLGTFAPILIMVVFFIFLMNQMQGAGTRS